MLIERNSCKYRKPGTGCVSMLNDHLFEGRYSPTNAYGKRVSKTVYARTKEECEEKLAAMIARIKAEIAEEKKRLKAGGDPSCQVKIPAAINKEIGKNASGTAPPEALVDLFMIL